MNASIGRIEASGDLRRLQHAVFSAVTRPFESSADTVLSAVDMSTRQVSDRHITDAARLSKLDRLDIYHRQYWYRVIDSLTEDFPGLRAVLGARAFDSVVRSYLEQYPSRSFTLRNLGSKLAQFVRESRHPAVRRRRAAAEMAEFEWAQILSFDAAQEPILTVQAVRQIRNDAATLKLQPHLVLVPMHYGFDDIIVELRTVPPDSRPVDLPPYGKRFVAVHRQMNSIYYKRLEWGEFQTLSMLQGGVPLSEAVESGAVRLRQQGKSWSEIPPVVSGWFASWAAIGWFVDDGCSNSQIQEKKEGERTT